jgi:hypothetical protein
MYKISRPNVLHLDGVSWDEFEKWKAKRPPLEPAILSETSYDKLPNVFEYKNVAPWCELKTCCAHCSLDVGERTFPIPTTCRDATACNVLTTGACSAPCALSYVLAHYHEKDRYTAYQLIEKIYTSFSGDNQTPITAGLDTRQLTKYGGNTSAQEYHAYAQRKF